MTYFLNAYICLEHHYISLFQDGSSVICNKVTYSDNGVVVFSTDQEIQLPEGAEHEYSSIPAITDQLPEMLLSNEGLYLFIFDYL